jgi:3-phenylpropionate/trans-cinnamate dioxygenase ferredoxin reductase component
MSGRLRQVVVVGASLAGLRSVEALRRQGYDGRIVVLGAERHWPYDRPPLSKEVLAGKWDGARTALRKPESYADLGADWRLGSAATGLDLRGRAVLAGDARVPFDALVIATGATPRRLAGPSLEGVHVLRSLDDCLAIRRALDAGARLAVVGAGFIGGEVAATARGRGLEVAMIEALPAPLERQLGDAMGARVMALHRDHGVALQVGVGVQALEGSGRVERVRLVDGSVVEADLVVLGIGVVPGTRWLEGSGLALADGVVCDERCRASAPDVFAVGDVARWTHPGYGESLRVEHWTNATEQADAAMTSLLAGDGPCEPYASIPYFWSDQFGTKIQLAGRALPGDTVRVVDGSVEEGRFVALYGREGRFVAALGFNRPRLVMQYRRLLREGASFEEALRGPGD